MISHQDTLPGLGGGCQSGTISCGGDFRGVGKGGLDGWGVYAAAGGSCGVVGGAWTPGVGNIPPGASK